CLMAAADRTVTIHVQPDLSKLRTGLWCPHCKLPSGIEVPLLTISGSGVGPLGVFRRCHDCDQPLTEGE
ncbi:MAG: hypothetical protein M3Y90_15775, partial [Actinomycetota bacterium]|nr:hypothetical protein [Actinomycetota bacterium]